MGGIILAGNLIAYMWYNKFVMMPILLVFKLVGLVLTLMWSKHIFLQKNPFITFVVVVKVLFAPSISAILRISNN